MIEKPPADRPYRLEFTFYRPYSVEPEPFGEWLTPEEAAPLVQARAVGEAAMCPLLIDRINAKCAGGQVPALPRDLWVTFASPPHEYEGRVVPLSRTIIADVNIELAHMAAGELPLVERRQQQRRHDDPALHAPGESALLRRLLQLERLVTRVANLNPDAGEIGPGMLRSLVDEARRLKDER